MTETRDTKQFLVNYRNLFQPFFLFPDSKFHAAISKIAYPFFPVDKMFPTLKSFSYCVYQKGSRFKALLNY